MDQRVYPGVLLWFMPAVNAPEISTRLWLNPWASARLHLINLSMHAVQGQWWGWLSLSARNRHISWQLPNSIMYIYRSTIPRPCLSKEVFRRFVRSKYSKKFREFTLNASEIVRECVKICARTHEFSIQSISLGFVSALSQTGEETVCSLKFPSNGFLIVKFTTWPGTSAQSNKYLLISSSSIR